eukprot:gene12656-19600_t
MALTGWRTRSAIRSSACTVRPGLSRCAAPYWLKPSARPAASPPNSCSHGLLKRGWVVGPWTAQLSGNLAQSVNWREFDDYRGNWSTVIRAAPIELEEHPRQGHHMFAFKLTLILLGALLYLVGTAGWFFWLGPRLLADGETADILYAFVGTCVWLLITFARPTAAGGR